MSIDYDTILVRQNPDIKEIQTSIVAPPGTTGVGSGNWQPPEDSNGGDNTDGGGGNPGGGDGGGGDSGGGDGVICPPDFPECLPQDCNALQSFDALYPSSGYALLYSSATFETLTNEVLRPSGWAKLNVTRNPPTDENTALTSTLRNAGVPSGPCGTEKLYSTVFSAGTSSSIRYVPAAIEAVWNQTGITEEQAQGSMGCYLWGRDASGNRKDCRQNLLVSRAFAWKGSGPSGGYQIGTTNTDVAIDVVAEAGGVFLECTTTGERIQVSSGNDLTGGYFVTWENTWSIDPSGNVSVIATATVKASRGGALSVTRTGNASTGPGSWEPGTTLNMPQNFNKDKYTCYFETATNNPLLLSAFSVDDDDSIVVAEEFLVALERSLQGYVPPTYCTRIP